MKHITLVATVSKTNPNVVGIHSVVPLGEPETKKSNEVNKVMREESVQMSASLTQKFEYLSPNNLRSAQSFFKMNETSKLDGKTQNQFTKR